MLAAYPTLPGVSVRYPLKSTERDSDNKAEAEAVRLLSAVEAGTVELVVLYETEALAL
jgi:ABC-type molybdate transport system substrate-binding protein